jgi:hypothetical protein
MRPYEKMRVIRTLEEQRQREIKMLIPINRDQHLLLRK